MSDSTEARVRQIVSTLFDVPLAQVTLETSSKTLPAWSSMGHLTLVLELEQEFGISLPPEVVEKMTDVAAVVKAVDAGHPE